MIDVVAERRRAQGEIEGGWMKTEAMIDADANNPGNSRC
jgi:hypothetical protein